MKNTTNGDAGGNSGVFQNVTGKQPAVVVLVLFLGVAASCFVLYNSSYPLRFLPSSWRSTVLIGSSHDLELERVLKGAATPNKTVIITTSNQAWAAPNSTIDLFLESFNKGNGTKRLLNHLVIVSLDHVAHARCLDIHQHCYELKGEGGASKQQSRKEAYFMTPVYLKMMWRRIDFLTTVLEMGYNFIFTDADIMWLRDPFPHFFQDADFQIACDQYNGNPDDINNSPNGGFNYVKSNNRTIQFYKYWYSSRTAYPGKHDQDVFNMIKSDSFIKDLGLRIKFLNTAYFGGFCEPSKDFNLVCTMHANCCFGLENKVYDLKLVLEDWTDFYNSLNSTNIANSSSFSWRAPQHCSLSNFHPPDQP